MLWVLVFSFGLGIVGFALLAYGSVALQDAGATYMTVGLACVILSTAVGLLLRVILRKRLVALRAERAVLRAEVQLKHERMEMARRISTPGGGE